MSPEEQESINEVELAKNALKKAFKTVEQTSNPLKPEVAKGWIEGLIPSLNKYNTTVDKHKMYIDTENNKLKYATLIRSANGIYGINYGSTELYFYIHKLDDPYYTGNRIWRGGKRIKSKKRTKSRKSKKLKKTRKR